MLFTYGLMHKLGMCGVCNQIIIGMIRERQDYNTEAPRPSCKSAIRCLLTFDSKVHFVKVVWLEEDLRW